MPIFASLLWLFITKRWYYFDHGIFTLHYFSLFLLTIIYNLGSGNRIDFNKAVSDIIESILIFLFVVLWFVFIFFEHTELSRIKINFKTKSTAFICFKLFSLWSLYCIYFTFILHKHSIILKKNGLKFKVR
jgi:hypothetical protein